MDSDYYEGTGYGKVALTLRSTTVLVISMSVRARSENGILFYIGTEVGNFKKKRYFGNKGYLCLSLIAYPFSYQRINTSL